MDKAQAQTTHREEIEVEKGKTKGRNEKHDVYVSQSQGLLHFISISTDRLRGLRHTRHIQVNQHRVCSAASTNRDSSWTHFSLFNFDFSR
jgi:hypothetical protein